MKPVIYKSLMAFALLGSLSTLTAGEPVKVTNPPAPAPTEQKPAYLYFREGTFARTGNQRVTCEIKLDQKMPLAARKQKIVFFLAFDIDNDGTTGTQYITFPGFGKDIAVWLTKEPNQSRFVPDSSTLIAKGKKHEIEVTKSRVDDETISFELKSELFAYYPTCRVYAMSNHTFFEKGMESAEITVDQLPRRGAVTLSE